MGNGKIGSVLQSIDASLASGAGTHCISAEAAKCALRFLNVPQTQPSAECGDSRDGTARCTLNPESLTLSPKALRPEPENQAQAPGCKEGFPEGLLRA